jgi:NADH dehydrogenase [ubiquinone] 1 alpha subcomplex assembly factor 7
VASGPARESPARVLAERIRREGPIPFDAFVDGALYGEGGFFDAGRGAGRAGRDFVTSPEVGRLFGTLIAAALDRAWTELGSPDPFFVVEPGAGRGRLAADVLAAGPECAPALRYLLVERSGALRDAQRELLTLEPIEDAIGPSALVDDDLDAVPIIGVGPIVASLGELPSVPFAGLVIANELFDNLPFRIVERDANGWLEVRVRLRGDDDRTDRGDDDDVEVPEFDEVLVSASDEVAAAADLVAPDGAAVGARFPVPTGAREWLQDCAGTVTNGLLVVIDYMASAAELAARGQDGWLRTYRDHQRGSSALTAPGEQDITHDLPLEYFLHVADRAGWRVVDQASQADWLRDLGLDDLVARARVEWDARAHIGDLEALAHRSRVTEAAALTDPTGLGAHQVLVFRRR